MSGITLNTASPETVDKTLAPPGHDEAMVAKFEAQGTAPTDTSVEQKQADRPAWLPEKFKTPEDMAKAYSALEQKLGAPKDPVAPTVPEVPVTPEAGKEEDTAKDVVAKAGLDWNAVNDEFASNGALTDETVKKITDLGIPKEMIDAYVEGQMAKADAITTQVLAVTGGREGFDAMAAWMTANVPADEIGAFNDAMGSRNLGSMKLAMQAMYSRYTAVNGSAPKTVVKGGTGPSDSGEAFRSTAELTAAMKDPRYKSDPAFRADVVAKLARSSIM
jgi:hypothetical protein